MPQPGLDSEPSFFLEVTVIATFAVIAIIQAIRNAPLGYQDEDGFHTGDVSWTRDEER